MGRPMPTQESAFDARIAEAVAWLAADGCVAFPTETVWGLAACARSEAALERLRAWKGRSDAQPIALLVADRAALAAHGFSVSSAADALIEAFWPGPLTLVLPCRARFAAGIARADGAVGVRCSPHPVASALARAAAHAGLGPLTATSLNRTGEPPAGSEAEARLTCGRGGDAASPMLLACAGHEAGGETPSTVVDVTSAEMEVLRAGAIDPASLRRHGRERTNERT